MELRYPRRGNEDLVGVGESQSDPGRNTVSRNETLGGHGLAAELFEVIDCEKKMNGRERRVYSTQALRFQATVRWGAKR
jgi:hypothetical protein